MAERPETPPEPSLIDSARQVVADASTLVRTEATLARLETAENAAAAAGVLARLGLGAIFLGTAIVFLLLAALVALSAVVGWVWAFLILAGIQGAAGLFLLGKGRQLASGLRLLPERTLKRLSDDLVWLSALGARDRSAKAPVGTGVEE